MARLTSFFGPGGVAAAEVVCIPARPTALAILLVVVLLLPALPIGADHVGDPASDAVTAFVGDPLYDLDSPEGTLFTRNANQQGGAASVVKSFTVLLGVEAMLHPVDPIDLDDEVTISPNAAIFLTVDGGHSLIQEATNGLTLEAGEVVDYGDLLLGIVSSSAADASKAVAEYVAKRHLDPACDDTTWMGCETVFVEHMNERAADIGLENSHFTTPYGAAHFHDEDHNPTTASDYRTSARDIAKWFQFGWDYPEFRRIIGFQGSRNPDTYSFQTTGAPSGPKTYNLVQNGFAYPGADGGKGGDNNGCGIPNDNGNPLARSCRGHSATRMGRQLFTAYLNSSTGVTTLFNHGFEKLFHPQPKGLSAAWNPVVNHRTVCVSSDHAATASVTPTGQRRLVLWDIDVGDSEIQLSADGAVGPVLPKVPVGMLPDPPLPPPPAAGPLLKAVDPVEGWINDRGWSGAADFTNGLFIPPWDLADDFANDNPPPPPPRGLPAVVEPPPPLLQVDLAHLGGGYLVLAERNVAGVYLHLWGITEDDKLVHLDGPRTAGPPDSREVRLAAVTSAFVAVGVRSSSDFLKVSSWKVEDHQLVEADVNPFTVAAEEFDLTSLWGWLGPQVVAAFRATGTNDLSVRVYTLDPVTGDLQVQGQVASSGLNGYLPRIVPLAMPQLKSDLDPPLLVAVASRDGSGDFRIDTFDVTGPSYVDADMFGANYLIAANGDIAMAPLREGGVVTATRADANKPFYTLRVWDVDRSKTGDPVAMRPVIDYLDAGATEGLLGLCRVPYPAASQPSEGDFLVTHLDGDEVLRLAGWRVAPRPT